MAHCLVTGGAGFIGSHLVERLLQRGDHVRVVDDFSTGTSGNLEDVSGHESLEIRNGSITDPALLESSIQGMDVVFHLAAAVGVKLVAENPVRTIHTNIYPTELLLRLASEDRLPFFNWVRLPVPAGLTVARRRSMSSWAWPITAREGCPLWWGVSSTWSVPDRSVPTGW